MLLCAASACFAAPGKALQLHDSFVVPFFQKANASFGHFAILLRKPVNISDDLLVAIASTGVPGEDPRWWGKNESVGVFIQRRQHPSEVYQLALLPPIAQDLGRIEIKRATSTELVLARMPEKGSAMDNIELLFDIGKRKLIRQIQYAPFAVRRIINRNAVPYFIATDFHEFVVICPGATAQGIQIANGPRARDILARLSFLPSTVGNREFTDVAPEPFHSPRFGPDHRFALVDGPGDSFSRIRYVSERKAGKTTSFPTGFSENIGPFQLFDNQLWISKTFYDGEGMTGTGGFGYFDTAARKYILFSPPQVRRWSISALLVEQDAVWLALVHRGEYGDTGGGVLRWDRATQNVIRYPLGPIAGAITRYAGKLFFATADGIAILNEERLREFFIDYRADGSRTLAEATERPSQRD